MRWITSSTFEFRKLDAQGPWLLFDHNRNTIALSPGDTLPWLPNPTSFGSATEEYVLSYPRSGGATGTVVSLRNLGMHGPVYASDWVAQKGELIPAGQSLPMHYSNGWAYDVLVPVNQAGIALLGDTSKIVPLARKRFSSVSNYGVIAATIVFASGENSVTLTGYAAHAPHASAATGKVSGLHFDKGTHLFSFAVAPSETGTATIRVR